MIRLISLIVSLGLALGACTPIPESSAGASSSGRIKVYRIAQRDVGKLQFRMLDSVNALRQSAGAGPVTLNAKLNAAAATHARDMSIQNRPWHFGSDGSSPIDRVQRVGYVGSLVGENISESYETELENPDGMDAAALIRAVQSCHHAQRIWGFRGIRSQTVKIWWVLVMGNPGSQSIIPDANPEASRLVPLPTDDPTAGAIEETPGVVSVTTSPLG